MKLRVRGMRPRAAAFLCLLLVAFAAGLSSAPASAGALSRLLGDGEPDLLPVEQAFPLSVEMVSPDRIVATWQTASGYYLYRDKLGFSLEGTDNTIERVETPPGEVEDDPTFGRLEVYHDPVSASIYLSHPAGGDFTLVARYQGCADAGVCYPPQTDRVSLTAAHAGSGDAAAGPRPPATASIWSGDFTQLTATLDGGHPLLIVGVFLAAGLLLAFSACLYPMIPILSGLIAGDRHRGSAWRAFGLSLVYVESTAVTYAVIGTIAGWTGSAIQVDMQSPWVLGAFALLFVALALSMFGVYDLQLPSALQTRISALSARQRRGTVIGVALMGVLSTLIVGACSGPALAAALAFIARTRDAALGALALFALANGMGIPLLVIGTGAGRWLPRAGGWMEGVRRVFGVGFLAVALWMLERFLPDSVMLALWGVLFVGCGVFLGAFDHLTPESTGWLRLRKSGGLVLLLWGAVSLVGASAGGGEVLRPLAALSVTAGPVPDAPAPADGAGGGFRPVRTVADLNRAIRDASRQGRPVMLDVYADWCAYCVELDERTFSDPRVRRALSNAVLLRADVTANDERDKALMRRLGVFLPPAVLFYGPDGQEVRRLRVVGFLGPDDFIARARAALYGGAG